MSMTPFRLVAPIGSTTLLGGVVGSTAYGLDSPGSDIDRLGVFAYPTEHLLGLGRPKDSFVRHEPSDVTMHEVGKMCALLLKVNPTVTELLWLPAHLRETVHPLGAELIGMRRSFLSSTYVRDAYLGYARSQMTRLESHHARLTTPGAPSRVPKMARHALRLLHQGHELLTSGRLTVRLADPEAYLAFGRVEPSVMRVEFDEAADRLENAVTVLPEHADRDAVQGFLLRVRRELY